MKENYVKNSVIAVATLLSLFLFAVTIKEFKSIGYVGKDIPQQNLITITGKGEELAIPDIATFTFGITQEATDVATAQKNATTKINAAINYLKQNGVEEKDIKSISYNINPMYDYTGGVCNSVRCTPSRQTLRGYEVSQMVEVKVRKTEDAGKLLSGVGSQGITNVSGLSFGVDNEDEVRAQARQKAIADAKSKAEKLAAQLGVKLDHIVSFYENNGGYPIYYSKVANGMGGAMDAAQQSAPAPELPGGEQKIVSEVNITYQIR